MRSLSIFALLAASASFASANTITFLCGDLQSINGGSVTASTSVSCPTLNVPGNFLIQEAHLGFAGSFSDPIPTTLSQLMFSAVVTGGLSGSFGPFSTPTDGLSGNTGFIDNLLSANPNSTTLASTLVTVTTSSTGATVPNSGGYSVFMTYTYEQQQQTGTPEPTTLALVGGVLVLAGLRKFRK